MPQPARRRPAARKDRRAVGYVRISKDTNDSTSVARQRRILEEFAASKGWELIDFYEDVSVSATRHRLARPGLDAARATIREGRADVLLTYRLDRVARSIGALDAIIRELDEHDAALVSATEAFDASTPGGRVLVQIMGVLAEFEASVISARVLSTKDHLVATGRHMGGPAPFGYRTAPASEGRGKVLEVDPDEAAHVRMAADVVLSGRSLYAAMQALQEAGAKPRRADAWSISSVRQVLTADAILGRITHRGRLALDADGVPVQAWPAVLPADDVERIRAMLADRRRSPELGPRRASRLLSGLVLCHACGGRLRVNSTGRGDSKLFRYHCGGASDGRGCTRPVSMACEQVEGYVVSEFLQTVGRLEVVDLVEVARPSADVASVEEAIKIASRDLAEAAHERGEAEALARIRKLKARRAELESLPTAPTLERVASGETFAERWERMADDIPGRRAFLGSQLRAVTIFPGVRGRRGLDESRVGLDWREDREDYDDG